MRREWMRSRGVAICMLVAACDASAGSSPQELRSSQMQAPDMGAVAGNAAPGAAPTVPSSNAPAGGAMTGSAPPTQAPNTQAPSTPPAPCASCAGNGATGVAGGDAQPLDEGRTMGTGDGSSCDVAGAFKPLVAKEGETCWEFQTHGASAPNDTTKFEIQGGESYNQFYYDVPWPAGSLATRFGANFDNLKVLHHYLVFSSRVNTAAGTVARNVTGTTLGENSELLAGWAIGGCTTTYPSDVGVKMPDSGKIMVQWHHFNSTGSPQADGSKIQICTVPAGSRPHVAGLTFLGTENLGGLVGMGPGKQEFNGSCTNDSGAPITIIGFTPHMHTIGAHMKSVVTKAGGGSETVFDKPFAWDQQVNYMLDTAYVLQPGDKITSTCTYQNDTGFNVAFGQSTEQEMCYQFALSYPYGALNNGVFSLIGATNTCW